MNERPGEADNSGEERSKRDLEYIYEMLQARLDQQCQERENLSLKATFLATTAAIVIGFLWGLRGDIGGVFFWTALTFLVLAVTVLAKVVHPREYEVVPRPNAVIETANKSGLPEVLRQTIANIAEAYEFNKVAQSKRTENLKLAFRLLYFGLLTIAGGLVRRGFSFVWAFLGLQ